MFHNTNIQEIFKYPLQFRLRVGKKEGFLRYDNSVHIINPLYISLPSTIFPPVV